MKDEAEGKGPVINGLSGDSKEEQLFAGQVDLLYKQGPLAFFATLANGLILALVLWGVVSHRAMVLWLGCLLLVTMARLGFVLKYRRVSAQDREPRRWGYFFLAGVALSGIIWGSAGIVLFPRESVTHQVFLAFVMGGMVAGAVGVFSAMKKAFLAYALPTFLPIDLQFFLHGGDIHVAMGLMILIFMMVMIIAALRLNTATVSSLELGFQNRGLVERLAGEKGHAEMLNGQLQSEIARREKAQEEMEKSRQELEKRVAERTSKLTRANEHLKEQIEERRRAEASLRESARRLELAHNQAIVYGHELHQEILQRKKAQDATVKAKEDWENTFDSITDMVMLLDDKHQIMRINSAGAKALNATKEALIGKKCYEAVHRQGSPLRGCPLMLTMKTLESQNTEITEPHLGGTFICSTSPILDREGKLTGFSHSLKDITESKRLEAQLQHSQRMEAIGTLAGGIAHDFNNLLMGIQGHTSLISIRAKSDEAYMAHIRGIEAMVERGSELTRQLLGFARGGKYELEPTDVNALIENSCDMFGRTKKEVKIHKKFAKDVWTVEVDRAQIEQVLLNLYVNAWQAMPYGGDLYLQTVNVTLHEGYCRPFGVKPGNYVKISVTDTGVGMSKATQQRVFDPFFTTKEVARGTGLGLSSAYGIVKNHRGLINVYSEEGKGSTFTVYLPASEKKVTKKEEGHVNGIVKGTETVLLVDDEEVVLEVGAQMLEQMGYKVLTARGGRDAVETFRKHKDEIDVVVLDMIMPDMSGGEAYDRIKEHAPDVKVLLSSGYSADSQAKDILGRGCQGFIQKPFGLEELSWELRNVLDTT